MKIIMFQGGLGNQLFEYEYYLYLKKKFPKDKIFGFYYNRWLKAHNGLEIEKWFDVILPPSTWYSHTLGLVCFYSARLLYKLGIKPSFINYKFERDDDAFFQEGFWQDRCIVEEVGAPAFSENIALEDYNQEMLDRINSSDSVCVHVRRGDYLTPENQAIFGNICTTNYYKESIKTIKKRFNNPIFFVFSNDIEYAKSLFEPIDNCLFMEGNQGGKSFYDIFLMSHCKGMILANSTFSCWAAYLNQNKPIVMAPSRWVNKGVKPQMNLDTWIIVEIPNK